MRPGSLIETAKLNGVDPQPWLTDTLGRISDYKITRLDELMPGRCAQQGGAQPARSEPPRVCRQLYSIVGFVTEVGAGCEHGVEDGEELASGGGYGCFNGFSGALQAIAKGLEGIAPPGSV